MIPYSANEHNISCSSCFKYNIWNVFLLNVVLVEEGYILLFWSNRFFFKKMISNLKMYFTSISFGSRFRSSSRKANLSLPGWEVQDLKIHVCTCIWKDLSTYIHMLLNTDAKLESIHYIYALQKVKASQIKFIIIRQTSADSLT